MIDQNIDNRDTKFLEILNLYWDTIPHKSKPLYSDFNEIVGVDSNKNLLRYLEKQHREFGIANYDKENEGITTLTLLATITDLLIGKRLCACLNDNKQIVYWGFYDQPTREQENN